MTWIQTFTGKKVYPLSLKPEDVCIEDIAHALSLTCRFNGHCEGFYSVAQHSVIASQNVLNHPIIELEVLMHDAHEAYLPDIPKPIGKCFGVCTTDQPELLSFKDIKIRIQHSISISCECSLGNSEICKDVDRRMLATECRDLMKLPPNNWESLENVEPFEFKIACWDWDYAKEVFLSRYYDLKKQIQSLT